MFKSPSFQFLFAGLSLLQQLISLMSFLNSWLLENRVSAWKPVLSKGEGLGTLCPDAAPPSLSLHTPAPPHPHPPPRAPGQGQVVPHHTVQEAWPSPFISVACPKPLTLSPGYCLSLGPAWCGGDSPTVSLKPITEQQPRGAGSCGGRRCPAGPLLPHMPFQASCEPRFWGTLAPLQSLLLRL